MMSPLVNVERQLESGIAATGLPTVPGPAATSQQLMSGLETSIEQLPGPEQLAGQMRMPTPGAGAGAGGAGGAGGAAAGGTKKAAGFMPKGKRF